MIATSVCVGSPPRARGKVTRIRPNVRHPGITPACAGKRGYPPFPQPHGRDHPRVRGEKGALFESGGGIQGSPPRARGKARRQYQDRGHAGITPACAGKSAKSRTARRWRRDHPRVRGEKPLPHRNNTSQEGSPPRARGKVRYGVHRTGQAGITPACAGKRLKHIPYLLCSCAKHLFTPQFCVEDLCQLAVGHSAVSLNIR